MIIKSEMYQNIDRQIKPIPKMSADRYDQLNALYHCETCSEIKLIAAINNVGKLTEDELFWWAKQVTYHAAFWDHTIPRFYAFLNYAAEEAPVKRIVMKTSFLERCRQYLADIKLDIHAVPGDYLHSFYWTFMYHTFLAWRLQKDKLITLKPIKSDKEQEEKKL